MSTCSGEFAELWSSSLGSNSAHSSPSQLVPLSEGSLDSFLLSDNNQRVDTPFLKIIEQPQAYFKFRYITEMQNPHGCLHGKRHTRISNERYYPGVELFNYNGPAIIKCKLAQFDNDHEHPHRLCVDNDTDVHCNVPNEGTYKAWFSDLCIIHKKFKEVKDWLYRGFDTEDLNEEEKSAINRQCASMAKLIQLNIVRLKFTAHDPTTGKEICAPAFSEVIRNIKSAATNKLQICKLSRTNGRASGGDDVIVLVERVVKKYIAIRFFEVNEVGEKTWTDTGRFLESDVHHQYAISFRTPPYKDVYITGRVKVFIELVRTSDGKTSDPVEFMYTPEPIPLPNKKRRLNHFYENAQTVPITSCAQNIIHQAWKSSETNNVTCGEKQNPMLAQNGVINEVSSAESEVLLTFKIPVTPAQMNTASLDASVGNMDASVASAMNMVNETNDMGGFEKTDLTEYFDSLLETLGDFVPDTGHGKKRSYIIEKEEVYDDQTIIRMMAQELQKIVEMIKIKRESFAKRLQTLLNLRLSNGDTFLHLTLDSKQPLLDYLINLIHDSDLTHLLNLKNVRGLTILHKAVAHNLCELIPLLVSRGCDPTLEDVDGNNAIHFGAMREDSLGPLLNAVEKYAVAHDLNAYNYEKQTPLHLAVIYNNVDSVGLLLARGANAHAQDSAGRSPLHLAVLDDCLPIAALLAEHSPDLVDEVDGQGYTALQILCDGKVSDSTVEMVKLLLNKKADPTLHTNKNLPAWQLARKKPAILDLLKEYIPDELLDGGSEDSEEEFESADEGDFEDTDEEIPEITIPLKSLQLSQDTL